MLLSNDTAMAKTTRFTIPMRKMSDLPTPVGRSSSGTATATDLASRLDFLPALVFLGRARARDIVISSKRQS